MAHSLRSDAGGLSPGRALFQPVVSILPSLTLLSGSKVYLSGRTLQGNQSSKEAVAFATMMVTSLRMNELEFNYLQRVPQYRFAWCAVYNDKHLIENTHFRVSRDDCNGHTNNSQISRLARVEPAMEARSSWSYVPRCDHSP